MKRIDWNSDSLKYAALECKTKGELRVKYPGARFAAKKLGVWDKITSHMPKSVNSGKQAHNKKWHSVEDILPFSLQCKTRTELYKKFPQAYQGAKELEVLDLACAHMPKDASVGKVPHNKKWTPETIKKVAKNFKYEYDFRNAHIGAYNVAWSIGILEQVCSHMKKMSGFSNAEKELLLSIKKYFPFTKKIRDFRVKIENKPYIKGFEIDIFVPELNIGIEFDGTYHHSFEYMRKCIKKKFWSDDDIRNYHEIKDSWFQGSKGIKILHIKEEDWKKDKQACVDQCLEFLGVSNG